jgi:DNA-binding transcriptional ArsR family regulator
MCSLDPIMSSEPQHNLQQITAAAELLADLTRARILAALQEGPATVSELASALDLPQPRVSTHLAVLAKGGVVSSETKGRQRIYRTDGEFLTRIYDALTDWSPPPSSGRRRGVRASREVRANTALRQARRCYDHLAGVSGVDLLNAMITRGWLQESQSVGARVEYRMTDKGSQRLRRLGVDVDSALSARRAFAFACPDWTEDGPHLGGALAHQMMVKMQQDETITPMTRERAVTVNVPPVKWLAQR